MPPAPPTDPAADRVTWTKAPGAAPPGRASGVGRVAAVDVARGAAFVVMAAYHFCWDLTFFGLVALPLFTDPGWLAARATILASFLALAGVSAELAARGGVRWRSWLRRLAMLAAAAAAITVATRLAMPDDAIWFGVLHLLAVASVLGLPFLRLPAVIAVAAGAACLVAPHFLADPAFNPPWLVWVGLGTVEPRANDFVPVLPWLGVVLLGMVPGRWLRRRLDRGAASQGSSSEWLGWQPRSGPARLLAWAGRHGLALYLIHQPVLVALVAGFVAATGMGAWPGQLSLVDQRSMFLESCRAGCQSAVIAEEGAAADNERLCTAYCTCVADGVTAAGVSIAVDPATLAPEQRRVMRQVVGDCSRPRPSR